MTVAVAGNEARCSKNKNKNKKNKVEKEKSFQKKAKGGCLVVVVG